MLYFFSYVDQGAAHNAETPELREKCLRTGQQLADEYRVLLQTVQSVTTKASQDKTQLTLVSRRIAQYVTELVAVAEQLKGKTLLLVKDSIPSILARLTTRLPKYIVMYLRVFTFCVNIFSGSDWVDPDDPTVIAENELLGAAASIDAAAKKLASLRPRKSIQVIAKIPII